MNKKMTWEEFLNSIMTKEQISRFKKALRGKKNICIMGEQGPTGKTTLVWVLRRLGYSIFEPYNAKYFGKKYYEAPKGYFENLIFFELNNFIKEADMVPDLNQTLLKQSESIIEWVKRSENPIDLAIKKTHINSQQTAVYRYCDESGNEVFRKYRLEPKKFCIEGNARPLLYNLPELIKALRNGEKVYIVEGEKDVETLKRLGLTATCNYDGPTAKSTKSKWNEQYNMYFAKADVVLIPDNDETGRCHMADIAQKLINYTNSLKIVNLELGLNEDVTDWISKGHTKDDLLAIS